MMSESQRKTIDVYENGLHTYLNETASVIGPEYEPFLDTFVDMVGPVEILEIGSATGRDADYLEEKGVSVLRTDVASSFIEYLRVKHKEALHFNVLDGSLHKKFSGVIANAVFLHFTEEEFVTALKNVANHLKPTGYFALSVKVGDGEEFSDAKMGAPRFFRYWQPEELMDILQKHNFSVLHTFRPDKGKWIQVITQHTSL